MKYFMNFEFLEGDVPVKIFGLNIPKWLVKPNNTIQPISIGLVSSDDREYYAINKDFNLKEAWNRYQIDIDNIDVSKSRRKGFTNLSQPKYKINYWLRDNVLKPIWLELYKKECVELNPNHVYDVRLDDIRTQAMFDYKSLKYLINKYGKTNKQIAEEIKIFIANRGDNKTEQWLLEYEYNKDNPEFYGYYCDYDWVVFCWLFGKMIDLPKGFPMYCIDLKQTYDEKQPIYKEQVKKLYGTNYIEQEYKLKDNSNYPKQTNIHNALSNAKINKELYNFLNKL